VDPILAVTKVTLPDGTILVAGGTIEKVEGMPAASADVPEIYNPTDNTWTEVSVANEEVFLPYYPRLFLLPDGLIFQAGADSSALQVPDMPGMYATRILNLALGEFTLLFAAKQHSDSAVMYRPGKILGSGTDQGSVNVQVIDLSGGGEDPSATWIDVAPLSVARTHGTMVMLADGTVLALGGSPDAFNEELAVGYPEQLYPDPSTTPDLWSW